MHYNTLMAPLPEFGIALRRSAISRQRLARDQQGAWARPPAAQERTSADRVDFLAEAHDCVAREVEEMGRFFERDPVLWIIKSKRKLTVLREAFDCFGENGAEG